MLILASGLEKRTATAGVEDESVCKATRVAVAACSKYRAGQGPPSAILGSRRTLPVGRSGQAPASVCSVFVTGILAALLLTGRWDKNHLPGRHQSWKTVTQNLAPRPGKNEIGSQVKEPTTASNRDVEL